MRRRFWHGHIKSSKRVKVIPTNSNLLCLFLFFFFFNFFFFLHEYTFVNIGRSRGKFRIFLFPNWYRLSGICRASYKNSYVYIIVLQHQAYLITFLPKKFRTLLRCLSIESTVSTPTCIKIHVCIFFCCVHTGYHTYIFGRNFVI